MSIVERSLLVDTKGTIALTIRLFKATINISTSSSVFYNQTVTVTSDVEDPHTTTFNSSGQASVVVNHPGTFTVSCTYGGVTNSTVVHVDSETTYSATLTRWAATIRVTTTSEEWYNKPLTVKSKRHSTTTTVNFNSSGIATYLLGEQDEITLQISDTAGRTYTEKVNVTAETTYNVTMNVLKIVTWQNGTDEEIAAMVKALDERIIYPSDTGWQVGDERTVRLNAISAGDYNVAHAAQNITLVIAGDEYEVGRAGGDWNTHFIVAFKNCLNELEKMETSNTNANGYHESRAAKCCEAIFNMIPETLQPMFKNLYIWTATKGGSGDNGTSYYEGKLALWAEADVFASQTYSTDDEFNELNGYYGQLPYFQTASNRVKKKGTTTTNQLWALRSPAKNNTTQFCTVSTSGAASETNASTTRGFAPFGLI